MLKKTHIYVKKQDYYDDSDQEAKKCDILFLLSNISFPLQITQNRPFKFHDYYVKGKKNRNSRNEIVEIFSNLKKTNKKENTAEVYIKI